LFKAHPATGVPTAKDDAKTQRKFLVDLIQLDSERVYDSDIKKFFTWFNALKDVLDFSKLMDEEKTEAVENASEVEVDAKEEKPKKAVAKKTATPKATAPKNTTPKTSTKGAGASKTTYRPKSV
jgi:hypothetical protein